MRYLGPTRAVDPSRWRSPDASVGTDLALQLDLDASARSPRAERDAGDEDDAGSAPDTLRFKVLTKPQIGRYRPRNVGAIWIEDASGKWVKTLALWATTRARYLTRFETASRGNTVDAVTSATLAQHVTHQVSWNLRDLHEAVVADGSYSVVIEVTDGDFSGASLSTSFTKGPQGFGFTPAEAPYFVDMRLSLR